MIKKVTIKEYIVLRVIHEVSVIKADDNTATVYIAKR